ncbi:MAG: helix-turn-helix domain-containing protein [Candidatus Tyrphobacter sp.]
MRCPGGQMAGSAIRSLSVGSTFACASKLTPAQYRVLCLALRGYSVRRIALELHCTQGTVSAHLTRIFLAMRVMNRYELLAKFDVATLVPADS